MKSKECILSLYMFQFDYAFGEMKKVRRRTTTNLKKKQRQICLLA